MASRRAVASQRTLIAQAVLLLFACAERTNVPKSEDYPVATGSRAGANAPGRDGAAGAAGSGRTAGGPRIRTVSTVGSVNPGHAGTSGRPPGDGGLPPPAEGELPPIVALDTAELDSCAVLSDGRVKCWGGAAYGQLGLGDSEAHGDQPGEMGENLPAVELGPGLRARAVAAGKWATCALFEDHRVKCWGYDAAYPVGLGTLALGSAPSELGAALPFIPLAESDEAIAIDVTTALGCAVLRDGSLRCWGSGSGGAPPGTTRRVDFGDDEDVRAIAIQEAHSCALFEDGSVSCWGTNYFGQLGLGDTTPRDLWSAATPRIDLGEGQRAIAIAAGGLHNCALLEGGAVKCWGNNQYGQLGLGDVEARGDEPGEMGDRLPAVELGTGLRAVAIGAGQINSCALLDDGSVKCWGGENVQLGLGDFVHGDGPFEMGDALPAIDLGPDARAVRLSVGAAHVCAVLEDNQLKCWGLNIDGELGLEDTDTRGDEPWDMGPNLPFVDLGGELLRE